jgi:hypothetical protein
MATAAGRAEAQAQQIAYLKTQLARIDAAERGLICELEAAADPGGPAAAYRARYAELYAERAKTEGERDALQAVGAAGTGAASGTSEITAGMRDRRWHWARRDRGCGPSEP